jgi:hypothetical protein
MHPIYDFSEKQRTTSASERVCIGREGHFWLCKHRKVTYADIERAVQQHMSPQDNLPRVILQCKDKSHLKGSMLPSRRKGPKYEVLDYVRPHIIAWKDRQIIRLATYWEEMVCHIPFNKPLTESLMQMKLDALAATSTNVLCRHLSLNAPSLARLAAGVDCVSLYAVDAGVHDTFLPLNCSLHCAEALSVMREEQVMAAAGAKAMAVRGGGGGRKCTMMDSRDRCDRCFSTSFGFRRWRGQVGAAIHEVWLYGQSYFAFPEGLKPGCEIWRQRLEEDSTFTVT